MTAAGFDTTDHILKKQNTIKTKKIQMLLNYPEIEVNFAVMC